MGNGTTERTLTAGTLHIDVDPLAISGQLGEGIDHFLRDECLSPPWPPLFGDGRAQSLDVVEANLVHKTFLPD